MTDPMGYSLNSPNVTDCIIRTLFAATEEDKLNATRFCIQFLPVNSTLRMSIPDALIGIALAGSFMIVLGILGSLLTIWAVLRHPRMRTPCNLYIANLAMSDLMLCLWQPFSLVRLSWNWPFGPILCKGVAFVQATNMFVSAFSITAIALDRFHVVLYPMRFRSTRCLVFPVLLLTWLVGFAFASPNLYFVVLLGDPGQCSESGDSWRIRYSVASFVVLYCMPLLAVTVAYSRICIRLKKRSMTSNRQMPPEETMQKFTSMDTATRQANKKRRQRRTNILLTCIGLAFAISWLPVNVYNLVVDFETNDFTKNSIDHLSPRDVGAAHGVCILMVLFSACVNPILYGWLNNNFQEEFKQILHLKTCSRALRSHACVGCCASSAKEVQSATLNGNGDKLHVPATQAPSRRSRTNLDKIEVVLALPEKPTTTPCDF